MLEWCLLTNWREHLILTFDMMSTSYFSHLQDAPDTHYTYTYIQKGKTDSHGGKENTKRTEERKERSH